MKNKILIFSILTVFFVFGFYLIAGGSITGKFIFVDEIGFLEKVLDKEITVVPIEKSPNSVLDAEFKTSKLSLVFVEIDNCDKWKSGGVDRALYSPFGNKFSVGDPLIGTEEQLSLYKTSHLCLVFKNLKYPEPMTLSLRLSERDKDLWIVE